MKTRTCVAGIILAMCCLMLLPGTSACAPACFVPTAGYEVTGELVEMDSGAAITGVTVELRLEGAAGLIGEPVTTVSSESGFFGKFVQTDEAEEEICVVLGPAFGAALQGLGPPVELYGPPIVDQPPVPTRAILSVQVNGSTITKTVDVTEDMIDNCQHGGTYCVLRIGTVTLVAD